jgi:hypothetical protein
MSESAYRGARRGRAGRIITSAGLVVVAGLVGALVVVQPGAAAAVCASVLLGGVLVSARSRLDVATGLAGKRLRWVVAAWAFLLIEPIGHFTAGRTALTAVSGVPAVENVVELAVYGVIGAASAWSLRRNGFRRRPDALMLTLPALALLSAAWSLAPTVTLGFSFELIAVVLLATLTSAILSADPVLARSILSGTLRLTVIGVEVL